MADIVTIGDISFIYDTSEIHVADTVSFLSAQTLLNAIRQAEATVIGMTYPNIADASGKDIITPGVFTGITVELLGEWKIYSLKTTGVFTVGDGNIIRTDGSSLFVENTGVTYIQNLSSSATVISGSGGVSAADVWSYSPRSLTDKEGFGLAQTALNAIGELINAAVVALTALITPKASQASVDTANARLADIGDLQGYTDGNPITVNTAAGTVTAANGKRIIRTESGASITYTRDDV